MSSTAAARMTRASIIFNTLDGQTIALDAAPGKPLWRTLLGNINAGETLTMAPLGGRRACLCRAIPAASWVCAAGSSPSTRDSGKLRGRLTRPARIAGADRPEFKPPYPSDRGKDLGVTTWPAQAWKIGGGTVWGWVTYDAELDSSTTAPAIPARGMPSSVRATTNGRPGSSRAIRRAGSARWFYQFSPHDEHDYDGVNEQILLDMPFAGKMQQGAGPSGSQWLRVRDRSRHGQGAVGRSVWSGQLHHAASISRPAG